MAKELTVSLDLRLDELFSSEQIENAQLLMSEHTREVAEQYVPKDTGALRDNVTIDGPNITYEQGYANYVYNMVDVDWTTEGTCGHWLEPVKANHMDEIERFVGDCLLGGAR